MVYLVGCKGDLEREVSEELVRDTYQAKNYFVTSAKKNEGVDEAFKKIERDLMGKSKIASGIMLSGRF